jgi:Iguana/Dzip1-like DAZ-interacting protein N-terminal
VCFFFLVAFERLLESRKSSCNRTFFSDLTTLPISARGAHGLRQELAIAPEKMPESGFYFRQRAARLDWKKIAQLDLDDLITTVDLTALQHLVDDVAFSHISSADMPPVFGDDLSLKVLNLSQLMIEYLLHVQSQQEHGLHTLSGELQKAKYALKRLRRHGGSAEVDHARDREIMHYEHIMSTCQVQSHVILPLSVCMHSQRFPFAITAVLGVF